MTAALKTPIRVGYLMLLDGRCIASNHYGDCGLSRHNQWPWIVGHMISEYGCDENEVSCVETDTGDFIAVDGLIVGYLDVQQ